MQQGLVYHPTRGNADMRPLFRSPMVARIVTLCLCVVFVASLVGAAWLTIWLTQLGANVLATAADQHISSNIADLGNRELTLPNLLPTR